jgi:chromosome segregation ATPase
VIETAMIFALGFLVASLLGLLVLPAVNARAARLARRRAEARLPLSPGEIAAERDFLRAQFAVRERRLERAVEVVKSRRAADMAAIGAGTMKAASLTRDLEARDAQLAEVRQTNGALESSLAQANEAGTTSLATLHALEAAHADLLDSLLTLRRGRSETDAAAIAAERDALRASLDAAEQALSAIPGRSEAVDAENADLRRRIDEVADAMIGQARPARTAVPAAKQEPERV